jgi:hypothetical protein
MGVISMAALSTKMSGGPPSIESLVPAGDDDMRALGRQGAGDRGADAVGRPGDQRGAILQTCGHAAMQSCPFPI